MATLNAYLTAATSSTLSTANQLYTTGGVPSVQENDTTIGTATGWSQIIAQGTTSSWSALSSIGSPNGYGFFLDTTLLSGQKLLAGSYTATIHTGLKTVGPTVTIAYTMRLYKYSSGTYTPIVTLTSSAQTFNSSVATNVSLSGTGVVMAFGPSDRLYVDLWGNCTSNTTSSSSEKIRLADLSLDTSGLTGNSSAILTTPGYSPNSTTNSGNTLSRLNLLSTSLRSLSSRFVLGVSNTTSNISSRLVLRNVTNQSGNTTFRAVMRALNQADVRSRFLLRSITAPSTGMRAMISSLSSGNTLLRVVLHSLSTSVGDVRSRFSLRSTQLFTLSSRLLLRSPAKAMDLRSRFLLRSLSTGTDASMRLVLHSITTIAKDLATRLNLKLPVSGTPLTSLATRLRLAFSGDTFSRANQSGLGTASDGETWTILAGAATYSIVSSKGQVTGDQQNLQSLGLGTVTSYQDVEAIARFTPSSTSDIFGILLRSDNPASNFYRARFSGYQSQTIDIVKTVATNSTSMANASISITAGSAYWIKFRAVGAGGAGNTVNLFVKMWKDGTTEPSTWTVTYTDSSTPIGTGYCGLSFALNANADTVKFDNYFLTAYRPQSSALDFGLRLNLRAGITSVQSLRTRLRLLKPADVGTRLRLATLRVLASRLNLGKVGDLLTRLRLARTAEVLTRFRVGQARDVLARLLLARPRDAVVRLRLGQARDLLTRLRLGKTGDTRSRLLVQVITSGHARLRLLLAALNTAQQIPTRLRLSSISSGLNTPLRLRLQSMRLLYAVMRLVLIAQMGRDLSTRFLVHSVNTVLSTIGLRSVVRAFTLPGLLARVKLFSSMQQQLASRLVLFGVPQRFLASRLRLLSVVLNGLVPLRLRLFAGNLPGIGTRLDLLSTTLSSLGMRLRFASASFRRYTQIRLRLLTSTLGMVASRMQLAAITTDHLSLRLRLMSAPIFRFLSTRLQVLAGSAPAVSTRLALLSIGSSSLAQRLRLASSLFRRYTQMRLKLLVGNSGNLASRLQLVGNPLVSLTSRIRLMSPVQGLNTFLRMRLLGLVTGANIRLRTVLRATVQAQTSLRLRIQSTLQSQNIRSRFRLFATSVHDVATRLQLKGSTISTSLLAMRLTLGLATLRNWRGRLLLNAPGMGSLVSRLKVFLLGGQDTSCRLNIGFPPAFFQPPPLPPSVYSGPGETIPLVTPFSTGYSIGGTALDTPQLATTIVPIYATVPSDCTLALVFQSPSPTTQALLVTGTVVSLTFPLLVGLPITMTMSLQVQRQGTTWVVFATTQQPGGVQFR